MLRRIVERFRGQEVEEKEWIGQSIEIDQKLGIIRLFEKRSDLDPIYQGSFVEVKTTTSMNLGFSTEYFSKLIKLYTTGKLLLRELSPGYYEIKQLLSL